MIRPESACSSILASYHGAPKASISSFLQPSSRQREFLGLGTDLPVQACRAQGPQ